MSELIGGDLVVLDPKPAIGSRDPYSDTARLRTCIRTCVNQLKSQFLDLARRFFAPHFVLISSGITPALRPSRVDSIMAQVTAPIKPVNIPHRRRSPFVGPDVKDIVPKRRSRKTQQCWETYRPYITDLYERQGLELNALAFVMTRDHGFTARYTKDCALIALANLVID